MTQTDRLPLRHVLGAFATGVAVITARNPLDATGRVMGLTVNSFTSVSLEPPLILWCMDARSDRYEVFARSESFDVNFLSSDQRDLSNRFAKGEANIDTHEGLLTLDHPLRLKKVIGWLSCSLFETHTIGDHLVIVGKVEAYDYGAGEGLTFFRGRYGQTHIF